MSVRALTDNAQELLDEIKDQVDKGKIETWAYDSAGDFTHTPPQWKNKAWLRPEIKSNRLRMRIIRPEDEGLAREVFAVYHGRFIEMLLKHVADRFTDARATPNPDNDEPSLAD